MSTSDFETMHTENQYNLRNELKNYHKISPRHTLTIETDMSYSNVLKIIKVSEQIRKASNELTRLMLDNYTQLLRTKRYRKLLLLYGKAKDKHTKKTYATQLNDMQYKYNLTWEYCRKSMIRIGKSYNIDAVLGLSQAENVWKGVEKCLYSNGKKLHFYKHGELLSLRAKQFDRCIYITSYEDKITFQFRKIKFGLKIKDRFQKDELDAISNYLSNSEKINIQSLNLYHDIGIITSTYRPCYATLVPKKIRGKYRIFLHIMIEGLAKPKYNKDGTLRHKYGTGIIGADIGTQTVAYTSETEVALKNLSERGNSIKISERKEKLIYRAMDRSRRSTNPKNYNPDRTIRKGRKIWHKSKHYKKLQKKHAELCRKNAINRQLAINEEANHLRSIGDTFITEPKNSKKLMQRAKKTSINKNGKINKKKRFGKSIRNRCPGLFQATVENKFKNTGGKYIEVPEYYRASQYDHIADKYIKKKLSDRMFNLSDGTLVQRDWYSSFLLYCYDINSCTIDKNKCKLEFEKQYERELLLIDWIIKNKIKILNSGLKFT